MSIVIENYQFDPSIWANNERISLRFETVASPFMKPVRIFYNHQLTAPSIYSFFSPIEIHSS